MALVLNPNATHETETYPLVAIREGVIFPEVEVVLTFGRNKSIRAINASFSSHKHVILVTQKKANISDPSKDDLYTMGILARIERTLKTNDEINALVKGMHRVIIKQVTDTGDYLMADVETIPDSITHAPETDALAKHVLNEFKKAVNLGKAVEFLNFMKLMSGVSASELADQVAMTLNIPTSKKQKILETLEVDKRLEAILTHLSHEVKVLEIERNIAVKTQKKFDKNMRENVLRERIRTMQRELGDEGDEETDVRDFKKKIKAAQMPAEVKKKVEQELNRFAKLSMHSPEHSYIRTWLETILEMPWDKRSKNNTSIKQAEEVLEQDHYALSEVKERIVEYLAVLQLKKLQSLKADRKVPTILCFSGPPGVGKTSIGRSIAKALDREFVKISLGGVHDEAEIRGHRRTYVGAMPGRIIQGIRQAGTKNPVFMLDEIDKVSSDFRGDPSAALLEALDPEQNHEFADHYIDVPFDLSEVIFITTANVLDTIPPALRDRLEIIRFSGYTIDEKFEIAKRHLVAKTLKANGLNSDQAGIEDQAIEQIIRDYTREAGVRSLEREISKSMRKVAKLIAQGSITSKTVTPSDLAELLGPRKFTDTLAELKDEIGLVAGLAWTEAGGDILFIEVALMPGRGKIELTGKLGEVMQESAKAAWSYVRSHWKELDLAEDFYKTIDVHIHVPEGAVPKDGPSAGVTMTTALISALTKTPTYKHVGMTGEVTLRGRVLEIGGVKEKVIAAHRAGLRELVLPKNNEKDLVKVPEKIKRDIVFHYVDHVDQVVEIALKKAKPANHARKNASVIATA